VAGHEAAVVGLDVIVGPLDDDPPEFAERGLKLRLEVVSGLGRRLEGEEVFDMRFAG
jgi:hypothetical protein